MVNVEETAGKSPARKRVRRAPVAPKPAKKTLAGRKYDWDAIRATYVEGLRDDPDDELSRTWPTMEEVGGVHNVPPARIRERAAKERWTTQRQSFQQRIAMDRQAQRIKQLSAKAVAFDDRALQVAEVGLVLVAKRLADIARQYDENEARRKSALERIAQGFDVDREELKTPVDAREINTLASAASQLQLVAAKALGTDVVKHEFSGPGGGPVEIEVGVSVTDAMQEDSPERLAGLLMALEESGLLNRMLAITADETIIEDDDAVEAEIVEEVEDQEQ